MLQFRLAMRRIMSIAVAAPLAFGGAPVTPSFAAPGGQTIIRDAEIEADLHIWTQDLFRAAGMSSDQVNIILVQSTDVNAFVAGGANIFIYTGLIDKTGNVGEVIGVIAHELGHIAGGHLTRTGEVAKNASFEAIIGALIGIGAAVATGDSAAAAAGIRIGQGSAMNHFLAFSRVQESSADQAGYRFMTGAGYDPEGLPSFLEKLASQELLTISEQSQYVRTHPLSQDRVDALENKVQTSSLKGKAYPPNWTENYLRMKAKLLGFIAPQQVLYVYPSSDTSMPARYARAIAAYRTNHVEDAVKQINSLLVDEPNNPYFHELKGQMLFEFGKVPESIASYEKASTMLPASGLIRTAYARALVEGARNNPAMLQKAIAQLKRAEQDEPRSTEIKRLLATAYGRLGQEPQARVYLAEESLMKGRKSEAVRMAKVTLPQLPPNSAEAIRAKDIINTVGDADEKR